MKISLTRIQRMIEDFSPNFDGKHLEVTELVARIGSQLGEVEAVEYIGKKYQGIIIAKIMTCEKHPNADKLNTCMVDDGGVAQNVERNDQGLVQVVCGAPNARAGITVAWLPPGSTVPDSVGKDPFVLGARELRGVISNGMLASPKELALGDSHDGILEITDDVKAGADFSETYGLANDAIIDIENKMFTHRPDCFGFMGVVREIAGIQGLSYKSPDWYITNPVFPEPVANQLPISLDNQLPELVPRFTAITMRDITIAASPLWLQVELAKIGSRPINNIVDYTNYFMHLTGQPLHAYDYDKVLALSDGDTAKITVRRPYNGETISLLNGKTITPKPDAIMIAADKQSIGFGGVMGGSDTEVDSTTQNIIIECANFNMYAVRRIAMGHGIFTDAVTRFNKGQSPLQNLAVLSRIVDEIQKFAGGQVASEVLDENHLSDEVMKRNSLFAPIVVSIDFINLRLGLTLSANEMQNLLQNVEFNVDVQDKQLTVTAPFWRTDIELREDIVEEVGRLYGYDHLPLTLPLRSIEPVEQDPLLTFKAKVRGSLSKAGANEVLTYSFVNSKLLEKAGQNPADGFKISNALSPDLQYYRLSLTPSILDKIHPNLKAGYDRFALFEIGRGHNLMHADDDDGLPLEFEMLDLVVTAHNKTKPAGAAFYQARAYLVALAADFGLELDFEPLTEEQPYPVAQPYEISRSAKVSVKGTKLPLGMIGEYKASVCRNFKLPVFTAGFGIGVVQLMQAARQAPCGYIPLPRFPKITQDITLKIAAKINFATVQELLEEQLAQNAPKNSVASIVPVDVFQKSQDTEYRQITMRISVASYERTLTDKEISALLDVVASAANQECGAERI